MIQDIPLGRGRLMREFSDIPFEIFSLPDDSRYGGIWPVLVKKVDRKIRVNKRAKRRPFQVGCNRWRCASRSRGKGLQSC
jgi:hypothetical protein